MRRSPHEPILEAHFQHAKKGEELMEDRMLKRKGTDTSFSASESNGKKAWQTPNLTEVDYKETRSGYFVSNDGPGFS